MNSKYSVQYTYAHQYSEKEDERNNDENLNPKITYNIRMRNSTLEKNFAILGFNYTTKNYDNLSFGDNYESKVYSFNCLFGYKCEKLENGSYDCS